MPWWIAALVASIAAAAPERVSALGAYWNLPEETGFFDAPRGDPEPTERAPGDEDDDDEPEIDEVVEREEDGGLDDDDGAEEEDDADGETSDTEDAEDPGDTEDADDADTGEAQWVIHVVAPRETLIQIATRYRVDHGKIRAWKGLRSRAPIRGGQRLKILARRTPPPREALRYVVQEGDTWRSIARAHGVDPVDLRAYNKSRAGRALTPGQTLEIWIDPTLHAAIRADAPATALAATIPAGGFSVGTPNAGRLVNGVRIPEGDDYALRYPGSAWGTTYAVRSLVEVLSAWRETTGYRGTLTIGAMSRQRGRPIGGHLSHQSGRDVDIRLPLREGLADTLDPKPRRIAWDAVWALVLALEASGTVDRVFLDYPLQKRLYKAAKEAGADRAALRRLIQFPRGSAAPRGLLRHSPGHDIHIHVRFRCAPYELECAGH